MSSEMQQREGSTNENGINQCHSNSNDQESHCINCIDIITNRTDEHFTKIKEQNIDVDNDDSGIKLDSVIEVDVNETVGSNAETPLSRENSVRQNDSRCNVL